MGAEGLRRACELELWTGAECAARRLGLTNRLLHACEVPGEIQGPLVEVARRNFDERRHGPERFASDGF